jgi:D-alanine-D-alanine ligase
MKIGLTFNLKEETAALDAGKARGRIPDDLQEEFDSPATIEAIAGALRALGHEVVKLGDGRELLRQLLADPPEFVFNLAEGQGIGRSREARVPAVLEMLGIPYSGSDPLTLAVTLDKDCAKRLVASAGVPVPKGVIIDPEDAQHAALSTQRLSFPMMVKPAWEGSSKGIRQQCVVERPAELRGLIYRLRQDYRQPVLVEEFIQGYELTVGIIGNAPPRVLGMMGVVPRQNVDRFVYSLEIKRDFRRLVRYECPPSLPAQTLAAIEKAALDSYGVLGCRDVSRIDFRVRDGIPYFLEVNPLPGLHPEDSDLVIMAKNCGWSYHQLIEAILESALQRYERRAAGRQSGGVAGVRCQ